MNRGVSKVLVLETLTVEPDLRKSSEKVSPVLTVVKGPAADPS